MKKEISVWILNEEITAKSFYDVELGYGGIELFNVEGERLGSIVDITIPDEEDEEEMEVFVKEIEEWYLDN